MRELRATAALLGAAVLSGALFWIALPRTITLHPATPQKTEASGYVGSEACQSCHPSEHASWSKTYHRTMTRLSRDLSWNGSASPRLPFRSDLHGRAFVLEKSGAEVSYRGPDLHEVGRKLARIARHPDVDEHADLSRRAFMEVREVNRKLVLVTGSHHYLAFWIEGGEDSELRQFPFVYLLDEARFLPRKDAFLQPPEALPHLARWNANCIQCHAVAGRPGQTEGHDETTGAFWERYETSVADLGISCEACHGPGGAHAEHYRAPWTRASARVSGEAAHIFVPDQTSGVSGSATCGQCHSYFVPRDPDTWWTSGYTQSYEPGMPLDASRVLIRPTEPNGLDAHENAALSRDRNTIFWPDGSIMVGGREYNGLTQSPCHENGVGDRKLACTHCHSMHSAPADKQIAPERAGDAMCKQCHENIAPEHTRHLADSAGSRCVNCHMPRTSYALLHGIASHQIASPRRTLEGAPHACALCHVDRDSAWLTREVAAFFPPRDPGSPPAAQQAEAGHRVPWAVERALGGNAAERALFAYALGTSEAIEASGTSVARQVLPHLVNDPYAAVRLIAERAQTALPPDENLQERSELRLDPGTLTRLHELRDNTPIVISE